MKIRYFLALALIIIAGLAVSCGKTEKSAKIQVLTTIFPLYDFVKEVGKDKVQVSMMMAPGTEAHSFEPTPRDIIRINESSMFVYIGENMEPWAHDILASLKNKDLAIVEAGKGIEMMSEAEHHGHEEGKHAFEWAGAFHLKKGDYYLTFAKKDCKYADPEMKIAILPSSQAGEEAIENGEGLAEKLFNDAKPEKILDGKNISVGIIQQLDFNQKSDRSVYRLSIDREGAYAIFTEHVPSEFENGDHFFKDDKKKNVIPIAMEPGEGHHHHHGGRDPHIWLDFVIDQMIVMAIAEKLAEIDPTNGFFYLENAKSYNLKLVELDKKYRETIGRCAFKTILYGGHFAFGYLAKRYGLRHVSPYEGFTPNTEPTPKKIAELIDTIKSGGIEYLFYEELLEPKVAETISRATGVKLEMLHGAHNVSKKELEDKVTFIGIMEENLLKLKKGLKYQ